jgi:hypothetical protein
MGGRDKLGHDVARGFARRRLSTTAARYGLTANITASSLSAFFDIVESIARVARRREVP